MPFCARCGQSIPEGSRFCGRCGADVSEAALPKQGAEPAPPAPPMNVSMVQPKRGGRLALGAFVVAIVMGALLGLKNSYIANLLVGGATTALLLYWRKNGTPVKGKGWAWAVAVLLVLAGFGGILQKREGVSAVNPRGIASGPTSSPPASSNSSTPVASSSSSPTSSSVTPSTDSGPPHFSDGTHIVGKDVSPGTYRSKGKSGCYFARLSGFSGSLGDIIANEVTDAPAIVTISPTDKGFMSRGCGTWTQVEPHP